MKKNNIMLLAAVAAAGTLMACAGHGSANTETAADSSVSDNSTTLADATRAPRFVTDSVHWADSLTMGQCKAKASVAGQYPVAGITPLVDSVRAWLGNQLSYSMQNSNERLFRPTAAELASGKQLVAACGKGMLESARADFKGFVEEGFDISYEYSYNFGPSYQTDSLLTYYFNGYVYLGGAHGGALGSGQSFDANNGRMLTADNIFLPGKKAELIDLIRDGLWQQYFKPDTEPGGTLADALLINPAQLELPATAPTFGPKGLVFVYQQYEIAPYAAGMPSCVLPYSVLKPLMRPDVARLVQK